MKSKDWFISLFLAGLLGYALCFRAGLVGNSGEAGNVTPELNAAIADTVHFREWIFSAHPQDGLTILSESGDILYRFPEVRVMQVKIDAIPDSAGNSPGFIQLQSVCGIVSSTFRIMPDGRLEAVAG
jgi:hypothetical protein